MFKVNTLEGDGGLCSLAILEQIILIIPYFYFYVQDDER